MKKCANCGKIAQMGSAIAIHSKKSSKRKFHPNLQKWLGHWYCTGCLKRLKRAALQPNH